MRTAPGSAPVLLLALAGLACEAPAPPPADDVAQAVHPLLEAHTAEFEQRVESVTDRVHVAVGFALANSILVTGETCAFVVDVTGSVETAREVEAAFAGLTDLPVEALVYTHNHADHVFGATGFAGEGDVDVYAHATTERYIDRVVSIIRPVLAARSARMFGTLLPREGPDRQVNAGIGPFLEIGHDGGTLGLLRPTHTFEERLETRLCGLDVHLVHAPGETNDQLFVWLPGERVLLPGDNVYKAFPNLYTIRGTLYRDVLQWAKSIDRMRDLRPAHLVPSHTGPVSGEAAVEEILRSYRDAIQFVHDQTIRGMNLGLGPDELVERVRLPEHLARHPWLQELYGTVAWSVRSVFSGYLGWFDGDAATLSPAPPEARARGLAELAGGEAALLAAARQAVEAGRYAWAAELGAALHRLDPDDREAALVEARALRALGRRSTSPNGRNYHLTQARELEGRTEVARDTEIDERVRSLVTTIPIRNFMAAMPVSLDAEAAADVDLRAGFRFPDVDEAYTLHVRRGVAELRERFPEAADVALTLDSEVWREIVLGLRNPAAALASGDVEITGSRLDLLRFLRLFRR